VCSSCSALVETMDFTCASNTSSASSSPISIGWPSSSSSSSLASTSSSRSSWPQENSTSSLSNNLICAYPSWPSRSSLCSSYSSQNSAPTSYLSDFELFPEDLEDETAVPHLDEAPAPPRAVPMSSAVLPLLPLYAAPEKKRRRRSSRKLRPAKPMTPIAESPIRAPE
jgi:hypothetical protein